MTLTFDKLGNGPVALLATLTVFFEQFIGDTLDLKTQVLALGAAPVLDLIAQRPHFAGKRVPVDFSQVRPLLVDIGGLQRLPAALSAVVGQISGNRVGVKLGIKFAAGVVMVDGQYKITRDAVIIRPGPFGRGLLRDAPTLSAFLERPSCELPQVGRPHPVGP